MQELGERLGLGVEPLPPPLGFGERSARHLERLAGGGMRRLRAHRGGLRLGGGGLCGVRGACERGEVGALGGSELVELAFDRRRVTRRPERLLLRAGDGHRNNAHEEPEGRKARMVRQAHHERSS